MQANPACPPTSERVTGVPKSFFFDCDMTKKTDAPLPYYKWYWQDWRSNRAVQRMTYIERGLYRELLDECWSEGGIPTDMESLADICGCPIEVIANAWQVLGRCFSLVDGCYRNDKLDSLRTERDAVRVKRKDAGRLGGLRKSLNEKETVANANLLPARASVCHIGEERREEKSISPSDLSFAGANNQSVDQIPYEQLVSAYNDICGELFPKVSKLTDKRRRAIKARWKADSTNEDERRRTNSIEYWSRYFKTCVEKDFFRKAASGENKGAHAGWVPGFDFLMREDTWLGVRERRFK